jgi:O-antigen ligase
MFRDFPLTGAGFGSFREVFVGYVPAGEGFRWDHVHNDYVELLLEGGVIAAVLTLWLLVGYSRRLGRSLRGSAPVSPARLGLLVGVAALAVHALVDFNHQVPANALLWVACCALLLPVRLRRNAGESR